MRTQGEGGHLPAKDTGLRETNLADSWSQTLASRIEEIHLWCSIHQVCGMLLWNLLQTNILAKGQKAGMSKGQSHLWRCSLGSWKDTSEQNQYQMNKKVLGGWLPWIAQVHIYNYICQVFLNKIVCWWYSLLKTGPPTVGIYLNHLENFLNPWHPGYTPDQWNQNLWKVRPRHK